MGIRFDVSVEDLVRNGRYVPFYRLFAAECLAQAQAIAATRISGGTGMYERSFAFELLPGSPPTLRFGNTAPHAMYLEEGTEDHDVAPVNKKALRWWDPPPKKGASKGNPNAAVFSMGHRVKGIEAQHIIRDAVVNAGENLKSGGTRAASFT